MKLVLLAAAPAQAWDRCLQARRTKDAALPTEGTVNPDGDTRSSAKGLRLQLIQVSAAQGHVTRPASFGRSRRVSVKVPPLILRFPTLADFVHTQRSLRSYLFLLLSKTFSFLLFFMLLKALIFFFFFSNAVLSKRLKVTRFLSHLTSSNFDSAGFWVKLRSFVPEENLTC